MDRILQLDVGQRGQKMGHPAKMEWVATLIGSTNTNQRGILHSLSVACL